MSDVSIVVRANHRTVTRGCYYEQAMGHFVIQIMDGEVIMPTIDYTDYMGSATISAVALSAENVTASETESSGIVTLTLSGVDSTGDLAVLVTLNDGRKRRELIRLINPRTAIASDYGMVRL